MPRNAKLTVHKEKEFGIYLLWKSLPAHARGMKKSELIALGLTDPLLQRIIKIKSQTEFAKHFSIKDLGTLTDWNARIKREDLTATSLRTEFLNQQPAVTEKIILPHITTLQEKISEQAERLTSLKRENAQLKKKLQSRSKNKFTKSINSDPETLLSSNSVSTSKNKSDKNLYKTFRGLFMRKKSK